MKIIRMIIGIILVLALCISPVAAVSGTDFEIVSGKEEGDFYYKYKYCNMNNPDEKYFKITTGNTDWMFSIVTFKPANIPDAPVMVVDTNTDKEVYLPRSVDEWEIKYYSSFTVWLTKPDPNYLKNAGTINLNEYFKDCIPESLRLYLSLEQTIVGISPLNCAYSWTIPDVD